MKRESWLIFIFCLLACLLLAPGVEAHQPRYIKDGQLVIIKNPEISQAFYGELKDREAYYLIDLKEEQVLYLQILVPVLPGIDKDKTVTVEYTPALDQAAVNFAVIDPNSAAWENFYEDYAGDNYFQGPSLKQPAQAGYYIIKITSPTNTGKYVLVVGEKEEFPAAEMVKALITIPELKKNFFQEPVSQWFNGKIGRYFGIGLLAVIIFGFMFRRFHQVYK